MTSRRLCVLIIAAGIVLLLPAQGQDKPAQLIFDVASVKPSKPGLLNGEIKPIPGGEGYLAQNISVKLMISLMYKVPMRQIKGGPDWLNSDHFDVEAKADHSYSKEDLHVMFQNLLADRFALKFHKEIKDGPVYMLTVDPSGLKMKVNPSPQDYKIPMMGGPEHTRGSRVSMQYFCWWLGQILQNDQRPVIDKTGLDKNYDFTLSYAPELPPNASSENLPQSQADLPSIFVALRDQLGLRLQAQKGPVEYFVIDRIEKPSEN